tara:strand:- start:2490 stop:2744 length:255 start_codon:yes stop_codon:yes gene_type:complete
MKILGAEEALATTGTAKGKTGTAHWVFNTHADPALLTIRNAADDGVTGIVRISGVSGTVIHTDIGVGFLGATTIKIIPIVNSGF